jgi:hypothetical protein
VTRPIVLDSHACSRSQKAYGHEYAGGGTVASLHTERPSARSVVEVGNCGEGDCCTNEVALVVVVAAVIGGIDDFSSLPVESTIRPNVRVDAGSASMEPLEACDTGGKESSRPVEL